jgi:methionyl-tRNA formyltransferase
MDINTVYLGAKQNSKEILDRVPLDPDLVLSKESGESDRLVGFPEYGDRWETVSSINSRQSKELLESVNPDIIFVISWPELLDREILQIPEQGCIGRHISLLPKRRGRAPVAWTLIQGLDKTGVSLFWLDEGVDSGDIALQKEISIGDEDEASDLYDKSVDTTVDILETLVSKFANGEFPREPQDDSKATYTHPRRPDMGLIDWSKSASKLHNFIRGQTKPYPGAFTYHNMDKVRVWHASVQDRTAIRSQPGKILAKHQSDTYLVQTGEGTLMIDVENEDGESPLAVGSTLGCLY